MSEQEGAFSFVGVSGLVGIAAIAEVGVAFSAVGAARPLASCFVPDWARYGVIG
jgi:hypothetical protein